MKTEIKPWGVVLTISYENNTYHGIVQNDFERFKTFGNLELSTETLILFDSEFNRLSFSEEENSKTCELYDLFEEEIEKIVVNQESDEDEDDDIDPAGGHGLHSHI